MMSKADKMFEEAGYKKQTYGVTRISFVKAIDSDGYCLNSISFERKKQICIINASVTAYELLIISEKVKELGWN